MGYNTTILICNDGFDQLEKHSEEFVTGIREVMNQGGDVRVGNHGNVVQVMKTEHADVFRLYCSEGNALTELSPFSVETSKLVQTHPEQIKDYIQKARWFLDDLEKHLRKSLAVYEWDDERFGYSIEPFAFNTRTKPKDFKQINGSYLVSERGYCFDLADGKYDDGSPHIQRWTMEAVHHRFIHGSVLILQGFVSVENFDDDYVQRWTPLPFSGYKKMEWRVEL